MLFRSVMTASPLALKGGTAGELVLQNLINERLILEWGEKTRDIPSDKEVEAEVERSKEQGGVRIALQRGFITEEYLRYELKVQLTRFNIATVSVSASPEDVEAWYKKNVTRFTVPERWGLSVIRTVDSAKIEQVTKGLKAGKSFDSLEIGRAHV